MAQVFLMHVLFSKIEDLHAPDLATRELGEQAYPFLREALLSTDEGEVLALDFKEVRVMDSSFAGRSVIELLKELVGDKYGERYLVLTGTTDSTDYNVDMTIRGHGLKLGLQVIERAGGRAGNHQLLGQLEPNLEKTLKLVNKSGELTARDLADSQPGMAINSASNRLKKLFDLHLVRRREEVTDTGRQHIYRAL